MSRLLFLLPLSVAAAVPAAVPAVPVLTQPLMGIPLAEALKQIKKDTGVEAVSELPAGLHVDVPKGATAWEALEGIAAKADAQVLPPIRGSSLRLAPLPAGTRRLPTCLDGPFRFRLHRIHSTRDLDSGRGTTTLSLEAGWLPTARPLFVGNTPQQVRARDGTGKPLAAPAEGVNLIAVDGRFVHMLDINLPAVPRADTRLSLVEGKVVAVLPTEMLKFSLDADLDTMLGAKPDGDLRAKDEKGVRCSVERIVLGRDRWTVRLALKYPPKANRILESHQAGSMVVFNEAVLSHRDGKRTLSPVGASSEEISATRTVVTYHFTEGGMAPKGKAADWRLAYTAPASIVEASFKFSFKDVPLP